MEKGNHRIYKGFLWASVCLFILVSYHPKKEISFPVGSTSLVADTLKQKAYLEKVLSLLPPSGFNSHGNMNALVRKWVKNTNELPPDFEKMPSIPFLPDPFIIDEGGKNIAVTAIRRWKEQREWMKEQLQYYITGAYAPAPDNLQAKVITEKKDGETTHRALSEQL